MSPVDLAQRDDGFAAAVITPLVERHVGDAAFYWTQSSLLNLSASNTHLDLALPRQGGGASLIRCEKTNHVHGNEIKCRFFPLPAPKLSTHEE